jgi:DNA (cytosine-5)-methyltransferase 1
MSRERPRLLDLFCGAGGAAAGYAKAGFEVIGVDIAPMPRYPYEFIQADALEVPQALNLDSFDVIHASPPCQRYSIMSNCIPGLSAEYPDLIGSVRSLLLTAGLPFVIENVTGSPLDDPIILCGSQFDRTAFWPEIGMTVALRRHRGFECHGFRPPDAGPHDHSLRSVSVVGGGAKHFATSKGGTKVARDLMGIDWMTKSELNEAIPPAYTNYIGRYLLGCLAGTKARYVLAR